MRWGAPRRRRGERRPGGAPAPCNCSPGARRPSRWRKPWAAASRASPTVSNWATTWRRAGRTHLRDQARTGRPRRLEQADEHRLETLLASDPQAPGLLATGWTVPLLVPLLQTQLAHAGSAVSEHTLRRALHRLRG